ncbi:MAG: c-type cytochrome [Candidatus Rokubacteria bacterium]|nr:c-type cytochrome [Candidatus Rokubacteria bacterium]
MARSVRLAVAVAGLLLMGSLDAAWAQPVFSPSQDPLAGSRVFGAKGCVKCHSINGVGGKVGPDLARRLRPRSFYDVATAMWNHLPRMVDRMKQLGITRPQLTAQEAGDLVGFLYTLNYFDRPGNTAAGRQLFSEKKCIVCHQVGGTGGVVGPNLDSLKQFASPIYVASAMWNHGPAMAEVMKAKGVERPTFTAQELRDLVAFLAPATGGAPEGPLYVLPGRPELGRELFVEKRCIQCHSVGGVGGQVGPELVALGVRRSPVEFAATIWNKAPAMMAAMATRNITVPQLRPEDMADLVAYLYSVRYFASGGSVPKGWVVASKKGCLQCHGVSGERGKPASDLTRAKGLDSSAAVLAALWNHTVVTPRVAGQRLEWPVLKADEMADLVTLLESISQPRRTP